MTIKSKLLKIKDKIHTTEAMGETLYYRHFKGADSHYLTGAKTGDVDATIFALCACEENGEQMFTLDEIEVVKELPNRIINAVSTAALMGNEKKPLDH